MYNILQYQSLSKTQHDIFFDFLLKARKEVSQPAHENMWEDTWWEYNNTLPYLLEKTDRFTNQGMYNIIFDGEKVVACSGVYTSSFCPQLAIAGTRTWINKDYRNMSIAREYLLPAEKAWAIKHNFKAIAICFNDYNKNMTEIWKRVRLGEKRTPRQSHHIFYNGINEIEFPVTIQYTKQWILYEYLDPKFNFDWTTLK